MYSNNATFTLVPISGSGELSLLNGRFVCRIVRWKQLKELR